MHPKQREPFEGEEIDPEEIQAASDEEPTDLTAPEVTAETKELTEWDQPPAASGGAAPNVPPDDEASVAEKLVLEGMEEADREQRIAAADPDYQP